MLAIGVGNDYRHDDGAGLFVARRLQARRPPGLKVIEHSGEGASLSELLKGADDVILFDAVSSGAPPGSVHRFDARLEPLPAQVFSGSTHAFGVHQAVELARAFNKLPKKLIIYGIEGGNFSVGKGLSRPVRAAARQLAFDCLDGF